jgi:hypothetical protein
MPACQANSDKVSALTAAMMPARSPRPRIGAMEKY